MANRNILLTKNVWALIKFQIDCVNESPKMYTKGRQNINKKIELEFDSSRSHKKWTFMFPVRFSATQTCISYQNESDKENSLDGQKERTI